MQEVILPALEEGKVVLCDRHTDSTLAYQGYGRGIDLGLLRRLNDIASRGIRPDLTLLFDCPVEIGLSRTAQRQSQASTIRSREDRFERERIEFHEKVRQGFLELAEAEPQRFRIIDAARSAAEVGQEIMDIIDRELP
jgi:dTMP kinase